MGRLCVNQKPALSYQYLHAPYGHREYLFSKVIPRVRIFAVMDAPALSLSALAKHISNVFRKEFSFERYWVTAEIIGMKISKGHCYLQLVEKDERGVMPKAEFRAMIWSSMFDVLHRRFMIETGTRLQEQVQILCKVEVQFHERYGLSLIVHDLDPSYTLGKLEMERRQTIDRLRKEGVYDLNKQKHLPEAIQTIAVISAEDSRGYEDFYTRLTQNDYGYHFNVKLFPSLLQGDMAAGDIISKLVSIKQDRLYEHFDAVIIVRGGGAASSLGCFNDYQLASAIAQYPLPVITGIGHTADVSVVDEVANLNLITPTEVANFLVSRLLHYDGAVSELYDGISAYVNMILENEEDTINSAVKRLNAVASVFLSEENASLQIQSSAIRMLVQEKVITEKNFFSQSKQFLQQQLRHQMITESESLSNAIRELKRSATQQIENDTMQIEYSQKRLQILDPINILKRGFSYTLHKGKVITDAATIKSGEEIETVLAKGSIKSKTL
jgi:exodeoxyribonuclease VII large subunit